VQIRADFANAFSGGAEVSNELARRRRRAARQE